MYFAPCNLFLYNHSRLVLLQIQCLKRNFSNTYRYPIHATKVPQCFSVKVHPLVCVFHNVALMKFTSNILVYFYLFYLFTVKVRKAVKRLLKSRQNKDLNDKW